MAKAKINANGADSLTTFTHLKRLVNDVKIVYAYYGVIVLDNHIKA